MVTTQVGVSRIQRVLPPFVPQGAAYAFKGILTVGSLTLAGMADAYLSSCQIR